MTGSSEGIGKAYARELAKRGVNIVLISRGENRLYKTAEDISMLINERSHFYNDNVDETTLQISDFSKKLSQNEKKMTEK